MAEKIVDIPSRLSAYDQSKHRTETARKLALAYVKDAKNPLDRRCGIALGWFGCEKTTERRAAFDAVLKPIEAELKGYAKEVKPDMSDADVNRIYEKGLVRWLGLPHEIDELRRIWLQDRMCK